MWNADFGHICAEFTLPRINALEAALLKAYGFNATVAASEYAKYYFHLRSMASRLQIESEVRPLDVKAATRLKVRRAQSLGGATHDVAQLRSATLEEVVSMNP